ncbi:Neurexin-3-alpha [Dufourea novaeangliae]|uniref:Neurexin-3-alpha n=1 Tax=Dufourea novaeangliae TaxID=178035 RepID=A0A154P433_DUFNO|nr:Neurexin-3-alpha [Dufourea novaeangliae]
MLVGGGDWVSAIVDGIYAEHGNTAGSFKHLARDRLLVGGGADARSLLGAKGINNFVGCLRKVEFVAGMLKMELIEAARSGAAGAAAWGKMDFHCREPKASDPITFTTRDSHLSDQISFVIQGHSFRYASYIPSIEDHHTLDA